MTRLQLEVPVQLEEYPESQKYYYLFMLNEKAGAQVTISTQSVGFYLEDYGNKLHVKISRAVHHFYPSVLLWGLFCDTCEEAEPWSYVHISNRVYPKLAQLMILLQSTAAECWRVTVVLTSDHSSTRCSASEVTKVQYQLIINSALPSLAIISSTPPIHPEIGSVNEPQNNTWLSRSTGRFNKHP